MSKGKFHPGHTGVPPARRQMLITEHASETPALSGFLDSPHFLAFAFQDSLATLLA